MRHTYYMAAETTVYFMRQILTDESIGALIRHIYW